MFELIISFVLLGSMSSVTFPKTYSADQCNAMLAQVSHVATRKRTFHALCQPRDWRKA